MEQIKFTITKYEVMELAEELGMRDLSGEQIKLVLGMVECDEMLAKDIHSSIKGAIFELQ